MHIFADAAFEELVADFVAGAGVTRVEQAGGDVMGDGLGMAASFEPADDAVEGGRLVMKADDGEFDEFAVVAGLLDDAHAECEYTILPVY